MEGDVEGGVKVAREEGGGGRWMSRVRGMGREEGNFPFFGFSIISKLLLSHAEGISKSRSVTKYR